MKCLLVCTRVPDFSFLNYKDVCELLGAKYPASPLSLLTVAALLPQDWEFRLLDLNVEEMDVSLFDWADLVMATGMIPQQAGVLELIELAHAHGKRIVVGGPGLTSQPEVYAAADYRVLDEGEITVPLFLADWRAGVPRGTYRSDEKPDMTQSPTPRFDLADFSGYEHADVQFSRGCPCNCEFCDVIEVHGRRPRTKTPEQMLRELDALARAGHRGHVHIVDDNFIGNRREAARFLRELAAWGRANRYPFFYGINATISLADDPELLALMRAADVRFVFCGIETPDREVLLRIHKEVNTRSPIVRSVHRLQESGLVVTAGFILGFDHESPAVADEVIACVEESGIAMALVGLLVALPATQLGRRLAAEGRFTPEEDMPQGRAMVDQTTEGLNFRTLRPPAEILSDYAAVLRRIYHPESYFARARATALRLRRKGGHRPSPREGLRLLRAFGRVVARLGFRRATARYFWGSVLRVLLTRPSALEDAFIQMALYVHLGKQVGFLVPAVEDRIRRLEVAGEAACGLAFA
ncbi:MAG TPA: B12-binding domain-containing radical SAM protein [Gemmataceae bacterium]|nr:B12-binding domain-containing radical SAM protein [Gemmataceae bacterium]